MSRGASGKRIPAPHSELSGPSRVRDSVVANFYTYTSFYAVGRKAWEIGSMTRDPMQRLSRRERQILDTLHRVGSATASEVQNALADPPSNSTVRTLLRVMEQKRLVTHVERDRTYVYSPTMSADVA